MRTLSVFARRVQGRDPLRVLGLFHVRYDAVAAVTTLQAVRLFVLDGWRGKDPKHDHECHFPGYDFGNQNLAIVAWVHDGFIVRQNGYSQYGGMFSPKNVQKATLYRLRWDGDERFTSVEEVEYGRQFKVVFADMLARAEREESKSSKKAPKKRRRWTQAFAKTR